MTEAGHRRFPFWKVTGAVIGLIILLLLSGWGIASCQAAATLRQLRAEVPGLIAEIRARPGTRPVLRGEAVPGLAWECYEQALRAVKPLYSRSEDHKALRALAQGRPAADLDLCGKVVEEFSPALELVADGAARADGSNRFEWERGINATPRGLAATEGLATLAAAKARLLAAEGRHREALDALSDVVMLGRDVAHNSVLDEYSNGIGTMRIAISTLQDLVKSPDFPVGELPEVARRLETMDSNWPSVHDVVLNEVARAWIVCTDPDALEMGPFTAIMLANLLPWCRAYYRRLAESCEKPWGEVAAIDAALRSEVKDAWNPMVTGSALSLEEIVRPGRHGRAHLRLLRAYVGWRITGEVPKLEDPFGGEIQAAPPKFWSRGLNGVDDGGKGEWNGSLPDIVLEVPAR